MEFKASLDTTAKLITALVTLLLLVLSYKSVTAIISANGDNKAIIIHSGLLLLFTFIMVSAYVFAPRSYRIDSSELVIVRPAKDRIVKLSGIAEIRTIEDGSMPSAIRTLGVGGLFGYFGRFYISGIGNVTLYATKRTNNVFIRTKQGENIMITPDNQRFAEILQQKLFDIK